MQPGSPTYEYRAWDTAFHDLPRPEGTFEEEIYLLPLGLSGRNLKLRGQALEIKDLLQEVDGLQLWLPAARLEFPIPAHLVERELLLRLALNQVLTRERYTREELLAEVVGARENVLSVPLRKRRHLYEVEGCRAEVCEIEFGERRILSACAEHEDPATLRRAIGRMLLDRYPNIDVPTALANTVTRPA